MYAPQQWQPLRRKLPLLISTLLFVVVAVVSGLAYRQLEAALILATSTRITSATQRIAGVLGDQAHGLREAGQRLAADSTVVRAFAEPGPSSNAGVRTLWEHEHSAASMVEALALVSRDGRRLLTVGRVPAGAGRVGGADSAMAAGLAVRGTWVGPVVAAGDSVYFELVSPVFGAPDDTLGFVVEYRRLASGGSAQLIGGLIGPKAALMLGNSTGSIWTDLSTRVAGPGVPRRLGALVEYTPPDGDTRLGVAVRVSRTPWLVWVEVPQGTALAPARHFLLHTGLIALVVIAIGTLGAWLVSNQITTPLAEVTRAAEDLAGGDYSRRVSLVRDDELGRLATSFNAMAQQVGDATHALEARVADRTRELRHALEGLQAAQDELVKRERLAILGQLAGGVGHELRNPLGVMTNALYYLEAVLTDVPPTVGEYLGILRTQIGLSERIVTDLLDFARVKSPERQETPLEQLVNDQLARIAMPPNIHIESVFPSDLPAVCVDRVQMGQVVLNLITNAVQAMVGSRAPAETAGNLLLRGRVLETHQVELQVRDSGPGIAPEHLEKIFEPLFTTKARGIGLGLAVSRTLARANGGDITVTSQPGAGARFSLTLPATQTVPA